MLTIVLAAVFAAWRISDQRWIDAREAVERARYQFVIGEGKPEFSVAYPRSAFEKQLRNLRERDAVLKRQFAVDITSKMLGDEFDRIERDTKAPEQWRAIKAAVRNDRVTIEEVICRPLLVDRTLHTRFAFDPAIHAERHEEARRARAEMMRGSVPAGSRDAQIARSEMTAEEASGASLTLVEPEARAVVARELKKPGDVSTILEYRDRFEVYRLIAATPSAWRVAMVRIPKQTFDAWYASVRSLTR